VTLYLLLTLGQTAIRFSLVDGRPDSQDRVGTILRSNEFIRYHIGEKSIPCYMESPITRTNKFVTTKKPLVLP
jgi:hypothetical protein